MRRTFSYAAVTNDGAQRSRCAFFNSLLLNPAAQDNAIKASIIAHDVKSAKVPGGCKQPANSRPLIMPDFKHQRTAFNQQRGTLRNPAAIHLKTVRAAVKGCARLIIPDIRRQLLNITGCDIGRV